MCVKRKQSSFKHKLQHYANNHKNTKQTQISVNPWNTDVSQMLNINSENYRTIKVTCSTKLRKFYEEITK